MAAQSVAEVLREQVQANESAEGQRSTFASHRKRLTGHLLSRAPAGKTARLCVLGAGNAHDLELGTLLEHYAEVHLVDLDAGALDRARSRVPEAEAARVVGHAPVDVSGALDRLERWAAGRITLEELMAHAGNTARSVAQKVGAPFEVVASACLLTQIQRAPLFVLGDRHPLFEAVRHTLSVAHLRVLHALVGPGGHALLATDISANKIADLPDADAGEDLSALAAELTKAGKIFQVAQPDLLKAMAKDDPVLAHDSTLEGPVDAWLWHNGPQDRFLVVLLELHRA